VEVAPDFLARYADGEVADMRDAVCRLELTGSAPELAIMDLERREDVARWSVPDIFPAYGRRGELRIGAGGRSTGARLVVSRPDEVARARALLPGLAARERGEKRRQAGFIGVSTVLLGALVLAYVYGVPLLAGDIVGVMPPAWEKHIGDTVAAQMQASLAGEGGFTVCDPDPNSLANLAINRFANAALAGTGTPFTAEVTVVRTDVANAFALPGGKAFFFSALLDKTETPDEFAGVLAHEMGHVVHRDGMQQLISSASTGLLIGFVLGDMSGLSVAGGLGTALVDSRFSRAAETSADRFAVETARRLRFQPAGLANLLDRVAGDDSMTRAMAFLSTHPLTAQRRQALEAARVDDDPSLPPAFTDSEWRAIKTMCGPAADGGTSATAGGGSDDESAARATRLPRGQTDDERGRDKIGAGG
jgi:Zn-dependent protease with chaperone function